MRTTSWFMRFAFLQLFLLAAVCSAAELPANFPSDVPVADYMEVTNVMEVRDTMMVDLQAPGQTIVSVTEWFKSGLADAGWKSDGESITDRNAILAYRKNGRKCGVSITDFVLNASAQMDRTTKGITLQITGAYVPDEGAVEEAAEAAGDAVEQ